MNFRSLPKWLLHWTAVAILAVVYYSTAELGRFLASTPDNVTPVWPPDGFALAAILLLGYRVWPGIAIDRTTAASRGSVASSNSTS